MNQPVCPFQDGEHLRSPSIVQQRGSQREHLHPGFRGGGWNSGRRQIALGRMVAVECQLDFVRAGNRRDQQQTFRLRMDAREVDGVEHGGVGTADGERNGHAILRHADLEEIARRQRRHVTMDVAAGRGLLDGGAGRQHVGRRLEERRAKRCRRVRAVVEACDARERGGQHPTPDGHGARTLRK